MLSNMPKIREFVEELKTEIDRLEDISSGYDTVDTSMTESELNTSTGMENSRNSILEEFDRSVRKITNNITLYRDLGIKEDCILHERALADSLAGLFLKTDEISEKLTQVLNKKEKINHMSGERMRQLRDELSSFHEELGQMTRVAVRYGCLKAEAASMDDMCAIVESIEKLWHLYTDLQQKHLPDRNLSSSSDSDTDLEKQIEQRLAEAMKEEGSALINEDALYINNRFRAKQSKKKLVCWQTFAAFICGLLTAVLLLVFLMLNFSEVRGALRTGPPCSILYYRLRDYLQLEPNTGFVPF